MRLLTYKVECRIGGFGMNWIGHEVNDKERLEFMDSLSKADQENYLKLIVLQIYEMNIFKE
jgi:hypothetical protein